MCVRESRGQGRKEGGREGEERGRGRERMHYQDRSQSFEMKSGKQVRETQGEGLTQSVNIRRWESSRVS